VKKAASGQNLGKAALSAAGNLVMSRIEKQAGPIVSSAAAPIRREIPEFRWRTELKNSGTWVRRGDRIILGI
jgi:hypothetical protein